MTCLYATELKRKTLIMHSVRISCQLLRSLCRKNSLTSQMKCFELNLTNIYKTKPGHKEELHLLWRIKDQSKNQSAGHK